MNNDLISRKYIQEHIPELDSYDNGCYVWLKREDVDNLINNAPSVDIKGEWIYHTDGYISFHTCNRCNSFVRDHRRACK